MLEYLAARKYLRLQYALLHGQQKAYVLYYFKLCGMFFFVMGDGRLVMYSLYCIR